MKKGSLSILQTDKTIGEEIKAYLQGKRIKASIPKIDKIIEEEVEVYLQRERVKAWVVTVMNPILGHLPTEQYLLENQNWTWRLYNKGLSEIRYIPAYIEIRFFDNYGDFISIPKHSKKIKPLFEKHDMGIDELTRLLTQASLKLQESSKFLQLCESTLKSYPSLTEEIQPKGILPSVFIEYLLNNEHTLHSGNRIYSFWKEYQDQFFKTLEVSSLSGCIQKAKNQGKTLLGVSRKIDQELKGLRSQFAREYGIPPVPIGE